MESASNTSSKGKLCYVCFTAEGTHYLKKHNDCQCKETLCAHCVYLTRLYVCKCPECDNARVMDLVTILPERDP